MILSSPVKAMSGLWARSVTQWSMQLTDHAKASSQSWTVRLPALSSDSTEHCQAVEVDHGVVHNVCPLHLETSVSQRSIF